MRRWKYQLPYMVIFMKPTASQKLKVSVDKRPDGKYRVQWVEVTTFKSGSWKGRKIENFLGKRTFNTRKEADAFAKKIRAKY
jgi:hypothetical protein